VRKTIRERKGEASDERQRQRQQEDFSERDEPIGPVVVIDHDCYDKDPEVVKGGESGFIPFGYKPDGMTELGWKTRREALTIAAEHGVKLVEW
jgi:hypothetical protein